MVRLHFRSCWVILWTASCINLLMVFCFPIYNGYQLAYLTELKVYSFLIAKLFRYCWNILEAYSFGICSLFCVTYIHREDSCNLFRIRPLLAHTWIKLFKERSFWCPALGRDVQLECKTMGNLFWISCPFSYGVVCVFNDSIRMICMNYSLSKVGRDHGFRTSDCDVWYC